MQKERKVKVTFLNEVSNEEALNMLAKDIANYIYNQKQKSKGSWIKKIKSKINIIDDKINLIGRTQYSLSKNWFRESKNKLLIEQLKKNLLNYFQILNTHLHCPLQFYQNNQELKKIL